MSETLKKLKPFWRQDGYDFIADIGLMKKAIVIRKFASNLSGENSYYAIGQASYFPFTDYQYKAKFEDPFDACMMAEKHIKNWLISLMPNEDDALKNTLIKSSGLKVLPAQNCDICSRIIDEESRHCEVSDCPHK